MISLTEDLGNSASTAFEAQIAGIFSESGLLAGTANFEFRPEQQQMACAVARTLAGGEHRVIEAGTGVGKSLAYLVPSILHAVAARKKAIISTHTINLQEQLIYKDIPFLKQTLPVEFDAAILKGRQNYCCATRLDRAIRQAGNLFSPEKQRELERIREWSQTTADGTLSDFGTAPDSDVWQEVCSERHLCTAKSCGKNVRCFYQAARRRALAADLIVINHTLFFTLLGDIEDAEARESGFLFPNDFAIFDEAHTLEGVASRHIGLGVSQYGLRLALQRLYNPRTKKGLFQILKDPQGVTATADLLPTSDAFFDKVVDNCKFGKGREYRVRQSGIADGSALTSGLLELAEKVKIAAGQCDEEGTKAELQDAARRLRESRESILDFLGQDLGGHVYWVEKTGRQEQLCSLNAAPVDLAAALRRLLFREGTSSVLTSATLSVGSPTLDYFRDRIGADEVDAIQIGSPFDYEKQMKLYLVRKMPDPRDETYEAALEQWIAHYTELSEARAFVLFTSYQTLRGVATRMGPFFAKKGWDFYVQGEDMPRTRMVEEFRRSPAAVLFGTESFWSGVDVAGEALSNVIITRLPFATPDHPLIQAKLEAIEEEGGDPFQHYSLPEAILKLRQGVGRLIRSKTDTGMVVILDSRVVTKTYGRAFLKALPKCPVVIE